MKTKVSSKGQIVLPAALRHKDRIETGQEFDVERLGRGEYRLKLRERPRNAGLLKWLLGCHAKGWFLPMDRKQTTDDITVPKLG